LQAHGFHKIRHVAAAQVPIKAPPPTQAQAPVVVQGYVHAVGAGAARADDETENAAHKLGFDTPGAGACCGSGGNVGGHGSVWGCKCCTATGISFSYCGTYSRTTVV
jgi:hypothetical protein